MDTDPTDGLSDDELADLARLADGTLPAGRREDVEARVAASPQLASIVESQRVAVQAVRAADTTGAPARLRADVGRRSAPARRSGIRIGGAVAAIAAVALALILVLPGAFSSDPSVDDAAALAAKQPDRPAPRPVPGPPPLLLAAVDDVPFPDYSAKFGWEASGARDDEPSGRDATTVYYEKDARQIAYTIVSGDALDPPADALSTKRGGVEYLTFRDGERTVVTWERDGRTCVLSAQGVPPAELLALADWRGQGAIPF